MAQGLLNLDRWLIYERQRQIRCGVFHPSYYPGEMHKMTPKQIRRCRKMANKHGDDTIGLTGNYEPSECTCGTCPECIPGAM